MHRKHHILFCFHKPKSHKQLPYITNIWVASPFPFSLSQFLISMSQISCTTFPLFEIPNWSLISWLDSDNIPDGQGPFQQCRSKHRWYYQQIAKQLLSVNFKLVNKRLLFRQKVESTIHCLENRSENNAQEIFDLGLWPSHVFVHRFVHRFVQGL